MLIGVNEEHQIKQVRNVTDPSLNIIEVDDGVFNNWSDVRILCYCYKSEGDSGHSIYPYVSLELIELLERQDQEVADLWYAVAMGGM